MSVFTENRGIGGAIADNPEDIVACGSYILPELSPGNNYYTNPNASGVRLNAGDTINTSQTIYVFAVAQACSSENTFLITIDLPIMADTFTDVTECQTYILPAITNGNYFTEAGGSGMALFPGDEVTSTQTVFVYDRSGTCIAESSFIVTIDTATCGDPTPDPNVCNIEFPTFFTPNGDGINDIFEIVPTNCNLAGELQIFDRYGQLLFQTSDLGQGWTGTLNGAVLQATDYWYQFINAENNQVRRGYFTLKR